MQITNSIHVFQNYLNINKPTRTMGTATEARNTPTDKVTLSSAGKQASLGMKPAFSDHILEIAKNDPKQAEEFAKNYAYGNNMGMAIDIPESNRMDETYYRDGTPIVNSTKYKADFESEAKQYKQERIDLYETEKSKGSSDFEILTKLFSFYENLPSSFQTKIGYI